MNGIAAFNGLAPGLYLVVRTDATLLNQSLTCDPFLVGVPSINGNSVSCEVTAGPKFSNPTSGVPTPSSHTDPDLDPEPEDPGGIEPHSLPDPDPIPTPDDPDEPDNPDEPPAGDSNDPTNPQSPDEPDNPDNPNSSDAVEGYDNPEDDDTLIHIPFLDNIPQTGDQIALALVIIACLLTAAICLVAAHVGKSSRKDK